MSLPASDNFNRADSGTLGANWTELEIQTHSIGSNQCIGPTAGAGYAFWSADSFTSDHYSQATVAAIHASGSPNVAVRISGSAGSENAYFFGNDSPTNIKLYKIVAGVVTQLAIQAQNWGVGDVLKLTVKGSELLGYLNGATSLNPTDSALTGGAPGFATFNADYDDWSADNMGKRFFLIPN